MVWFNITDTNIRKLQSVQIFSARIVSDTNYKIYDYVSQMLKRLRWLSVKTNLYFIDAVMVFKCMTGMAQDHLSNKFISRGNIVGGRIELPTIKYFIIETKTGQRSSSYRIVKIRNNLPPEINLSQSLNNFSVV